MSGVLQSAMKDWSVATGPAPLVLLSLDLRTTTTVPLYIEPPLYLLHNSGTSSTRGSSGRQTKVDSSTGVDAHTWLPALMRCMQAWRGGGGGGGGGP